MSFSGLVSNKWGGQLVIWIFVFILISSVSYAAPPKTIFYQGRLTNDTGVPLDGNFNLSFELHNDPSAGSQVWPSSGDETFSNVDVTRGVYSVYLGSNKPLDPSDFGETLWLQVKVNGNNFSPRTKLSSMPYAFNAFRLGGKDATSYETETHAVEHAGNFLSASGDVLNVQDNWIDEANTDLGDNLVWDSGENNVDVDSGPGSGLNADLLDGNEGSFFKQDLADVLSQGNSAGSNNIDMNTQDIFSISNLGINTSSPGDALIVQGGNVGIETGSPASELDIGNQGFITFHNNNDLQLGGGNTPGADTTSLFLRTATNPADGEEIFRVESSGGSKRFAVDHKGAISGDNNLRINGFPLGPSYIANESAGFGIGTKSPVSKLDVRGEIAIEGNTSSPAASPTELGFQHFQRQSDGTIFDHPATNVTVTYDASNREVIVNNNSGNWWDISIKVIDIDGGTFTGTADDVSDGNSLSLDGGSGPNDFEIYAVDEANTGPGFTIEATGTGFNDTIQGIIRYWR